MKPLEADLFGIMLDRALVEHMIRLTMSQVADDRSREERAACPWIKHLQDHFSLSVATRQLTWIYQGGYDLAGFATWWRIGPELLAKFWEAAANGFNLGATLPPDIRLVTVPKPAAVYVGMLVTKPRVPRSIVSALSRVVRDNNAECKEFFWWSQRRGKLQKWSGNEPRS